MATKAARKQSVRLTPITTGNPLWFKDAVIYQLHVRAFYDSNSDGIGDLRGLLEKLDYIQDLGVTAVWLLPFFPSPLRDDGYDTSDYFDVNPIYGNLRDFRTFLAEARQRELRVITEMVLNHTSDQHEWFQKSRRAAPGTKWRDYYVWSDTPDRYRQTRVIFQDFEPSNWTWDPVANAYYWHRFYHHQPDLNYENPEVRIAMFEAVDFWLEMGVDGLRLDAIPYLYEREGTNCENLPETHALLKALRQHIDERFPDKMLLAEANQWPEDASTYFGNGDECHMNFHFPLMPRLFMAIEREDRFPIIDILEQTPAAPENCQWAIFLRNHDELTLEMVTDEERDYMYRSYADDPQARVNLGIRRRLAPLLRNNRRKIELMNALLLSLPGTPIIYYGDELGMGDNIYLGDRNGVRTPMHWSADRNAGFSRANPQQLYSPPIIDAEYHFSAINVEVEQNSPHSLLWWMRRIIGVRKQYQAFSRGVIEFVPSDNSKVLAFLRRLGRETLLVVANMSRFAQGSELDLSQFRGQSPVELFGETKFPAIGELPYFITLGPHAFYWFRLDWPAEEVESVGVELPSCSVTGAWDSVFVGRTRAKLERALPAFLLRQPWFGGKRRILQSARLADVITIPSLPKSAPLRLLMVNAHYAEGEPQLYLMPVVFARGEQAQNILGDHPRSGIMRIEPTKEDPGVLCEAIWEKEFWLALYQTIAREKNLKGQLGEIVPEQMKAFDRYASGDTGASSVIVRNVEQANISVQLGDWLVLKVFRRLSAGENPDLEIGRFLSQETRATCIPALAGGMTYQPTVGENGRSSTKHAAPALTIGVLHEFIANEGDAWTYTLDEVGRYFERIESNPLDVNPAALLASRHSLIELTRQSPEEAVQHMIGPYLQSAALLGQRTAELHMALAGGTSAAFAPEPFSRAYQRSLYQSMRGNARLAFQLLRKNSAQLPEPTRPVAEQAAKLEAPSLERFGRLLNAKLTALRTRCHGDYHLGQVLFTGNDFVIIDFEGEPELPVSERRIKTSPLRDVAGMIRSFHYAALYAGQGKVPGTIVPAKPKEHLDDWMRLWYVWSSAAFLRSYLATAAPANLVPQEQGELNVLLSAYLLDKAFDELVDELLNRPECASIPLLGILELIGSQG